MAHAMPLGKPVLIIGAGVVGLALANGLKKVAPQRTHAAVATKQNNDFRPASPFKYSSAIPAFLHASKDGP